MTQLTKQIYCECHSCRAGMEIYKEYDGSTNKHRVSFEAPISEFIGIKKGDLIPGKKCYWCKKETLIKD